MVRKAPAFQFYADDFIAGTIGMTASEVGIYIRLLCLQWSKGRISHRETKAVGGDGSEVQYVLSEKFKQDESGYWFNERLEHVRKISQERSIAGSKGGSKTQANLQANEAAKLNPPTPTPIPTPTPTASEEKSGRVRTRHPSLSDVREYCEERKNGIDPEQFIDHYTANGWRQSNGNAIKDWQAAVRTWERNGITRKPATASKEDLGF